MHSGNQAPYDIMTSNRDLKCQQPPDMTGKGTHALTKVATRTVLHPLIPGSIQLRCLQGNANSLPQPQTEEQGSWNRFLYLILLLNILEDPNDVASLLPLSLNFEAVAIDMLHLGIHKALRKGRRCCFLRHHIANKVKRRAKREEGDRQSERVKRVKEG